MLINILLDHYKVVSKQLLSLSEYMVNYNIEFKDRMSTVRFIGDYKIWVKAFLTGIIINAEKTIAIINSINGDGAKLS